VSKSGVEIGELNANEPLSLRWPHWYQPTYADKQTEAQTLAQLRDKQLISQQTGIKTIAGSYDIEDPADELRLINAEPAPISEGDAKPRQEPLSQSED
jgi:hypothetical protein